ncbi:helix-turn-helix transcriptional regulator [Patulibacter defluvii]|uniref:helix-turn-helix transcriptional regulator n=1 Tax=Patulibacter defluvii TaxID=3095358 RepID=UPI002A761B31|nr:LuxR C-terminal-related transcriptional regulator [Patulibacter sp. DM4]
MLPDPGPPAATLSVDPLDPADAARLGTVVAAHGGVLDAVPDRDGGRVAGFARAADALAAAVALRRGAPPDQPRPRIAVDRGRARRRDGRLHGPGPDRCRELRRIAAPGQTLVTAAAAADAPLPAGARLDDLGVHRLPDLSPPLRLHALRDGDDRAPAPPPAGLDAIPNSLPVHATSFVGRGDELAALRPRLAEERLLTVCGPGGAGKTRLAARLAAVDAARWPDGVWWVELGAIGDPAAVAPAVAAALGLLVDPAHGAAASLAVQLAPRRLLLVLDNCEHVADAAAELAAELLRAAPEATVLTTSREPLGLAGEAVWRLPPLAPEEARELFLERAAQVRPELADDAEAAAAVPSLCRRLDGSPLALELAAAWAGTLTPRQIEAGLDDRFALLVRSPRDAVPRHASLLASIAWSHDRLDERERTVLRRLAVLAGGFDLDAARAVAAGDGIADAAVLPALARLVDTSFVVAEPGRGGAPVRYRLPESIRRFAEDRLRAAGERVATADRHLAHRLAVVRGLADARDDDKDGWREALAPELDNLRAAIDHGLAADDPTAGRELAAELPWLWHLDRRGREGMAVLRRAIARDPDARTPLQARLLAGVALVADTADPLDVELDAAQRAGALAAEVGDERLHALCLSLTAVARFYTDLDGAWETALEAERRAADAGERFVADAGRALRGIVLHLRDRHGEAERLLGEAAAGLAARGDRGVASTALAFRSGSARAIGDGERARELAEQAVALAAPLADHIRSGIARAALALAHGSAGDVDGGLDALAPLVLLLEGDGAPFVPEVARALGLLHGAAGDDERALRWLRVEADSTDGGAPTYLALRALPALAAAERRTGDVEAAAATAARAVAVARERGMIAVLADALDEQARQADAGDAALALHHEALALRVDHGLRPAAVVSLERLAAQPDADPAVAARLLAAATAVREREGWPRPPADREPVDRRAAALDRALGEEAAAARAAGAALTLDEAVAYARRARGRRRRPEQGWGSLTPTEVEVVRLAVDGLTNPQIGARLFMSRSTVKTHLSHVYAKLAVANRTELAAQAAPHLER